MARSLPDIIKWETTMNRVKRITGLIAFSLMILSLPAIASAQWRDDDRYGNDRYGNDRYGNGRYGNGQYGNYGDMRSTIRNLKNKSNRFERQADRELDRSRWDDTRREDNFMGLVRDFDDAVDELNNSRSRQNSDEVQRVLNLGSRIDRQMARMRVSGNLTQLWNAIEYDLNTLGNAYGYNNGRRNRGYGNGRGNGNTNNLPNWWPF
jgi:hypothetical protein